MSNSKKQFVDRKGRVWEWEETPEIRSWMKQEETRKRTVTLPLTTA